MNLVYKKAYTELLEIIEYLPHDEYLQNISCFLNHI